MITKAMQGKKMYVAYYDLTGQFNQPYVTHWMELPLFREGEQ